MDLTGYLVSFQVRHAQHPDSDTVHELFCQDRVLQGICEQYLAEGMEGGPYLVVRIKPDKVPVYVAREHILDPIEPGAAAAPAGKKGASGDR